MKVLAEYHENIGEIQGGCWGIHLRVREGYDRSLRMYESVGRIL